MNKNLGCRELKWTFCCFTDSIVMFCNYCYAESIITAPSVCFNFSRFLTHREVFTMTLLDYGSKTGCSTVLVPRRRYSSSPKNFFIVFPTVVSLYTGNNYFIEHCVLAGKASIGGGNGKRDRRRSGPITCDPLQRCPRSAADGAAAHRELVQRSRRPRQIDSPRFLRFDPNLQR